MHCTRNLLLTRLETHQTRAHIRRNSSRAQCSIEVCRRRKYDERTSERTVLPLCTEYIWWRRGRKRPPTTSTKSPFSAKKLTSSAVCGLVACSASTARGLPSRTISVGVGTLGSSACVSLSTCMSVQHVSDLLLRVHS
jgi:hypothetical protein